MKKIKLSNGVELPQLGYGVYQVEPDECERCELDALSVGYRMFDTAQAYLNEEAVGNALYSSPRRIMLLEKRNEIKCLFCTTKENIVPTI